MYRASKFCPQCKRRFPLTESQCSVCRTTDHNGYTLPNELWVVALRVDGSWQHYQPNTLNPTALRHLTRTQGDGGDAA